MTNLPEFLVEMLVYSGVLYGAIMLFKWIFRNKLSPFLGFALWFLLIARLCIPVTIDSGFHFITLPQEQARQAVAESGARVRESTGQAAGGQSVPAGTRPQGVAADPDAVVKMGETADGRPSPSVPAWREILLFAWLAGAAFFAVRSAVTAVKIKKDLLLSNSTDERVDAVLALCKKRVGVKRRVPVLLSNNLRSPALTVSFRPKILMPRDMAHGMTHRQLYYALCHELMHMKRGDHLICILMQALRAVYWFNPFVWMAFRRMSVDMETACDAGVVNSMKRQARAEYARTVISMAVRRENAQVMLGMSAGNTKKIVEHRVRGMFRPKKSRRGVRLAAVVLVCALAVCCFTTACRPVNRETSAPSAVADTTPESFRVSEPAPESTPVPAPLKEINAPKRYQTDIEGLKFPVHVDAGVVTPEVTAFPVKRMEASAFTQEEVDRVREYFLGDAQLYRDLGAPRDELEKMIADLETERAAETNEAQIDYLGSEISFYRKQLPNAPEERFTQPIGPGLQRETTPDGREVLGLSAVADMGGGTYAFYSVSNFTDSTDDNHLYLCTDAGSMGAVNPPDVMPGTRQAKDQKMTPEQAEEKALEVLEDLEINDMEVNRVTVVGISGQVVPAADGSDTTEVYQVLAQKEIVGMEPGASYGGYQGLKTHNADGETLPPCRGDYIILLLRDDGPLAFTWGSKTEVGETLEEDAELLPFDQIAGIFANEMLSRYADVTDEELESGYYDNMEVSRVELGYVSVSDRENPGDGILVPAWSFCQKEERENEDGTIEETESYLMNISAIDGAILYG